MTKKLDMRRAMPLWVGVFILFFFWACEQQKSLLVIRSGADVSKTKQEGFDSLLYLETIAAEDLLQASHLWVKADPTQLSFNERNTIERYLEAGGEVTFTCVDTIYNWGQLQPFFQSNQVQIDCKGTELSLRQANLDYSLAETPIMPAPDRLKRQVLVAPLREPICIAVTKESLVYWVERKGTINLYNLRTEDYQEIDSLAVYSGEEDGLLGLVLDPNFSENQWAYVFYSDPGEEPKQNISRFRLTPKGLDRQSEIVLMEIPVQRDECCHSAGDLEIDAEGNLYISTGDDTFSRDSDGFTPLDERSGRSPWDAQKSSSNTHDLRGKILRIHPEEDGSYTIPDGNLFAKDGSEGLPEIYVMGARNPFTLAINKRRNWLFWGDVGPDGNVTSERGPSAHDEINMAKKSGNYGWPYFNADNKAYADYDFETGELGPRFDPKNPVNTSVNNTGAKELPPAVPALLYYTFDETRQFPGVGKGSRSIGVGEVYDYETIKSKGFAFPPYYQDKLFAFDWARSWVKVISLDEEGNFLSIEPLLDASVVAAPIDMTFGQDGALYILEYGIGYFTDNHDSKLIRLDFTYGNRAPVANIALSQDNGKLPLTVAFSAAGSMDWDEKDSLEYLWIIQGPEDISLTGFEAETTFTKAGEYEVLLVVKDRYNASASSRATIIAGNAKPELNFEFADNSTFYWPGRPIRYALQLEDEEDGRLNEGIDLKEVKVSLTNYTGSDNRAPASLALLDGMSQEGIAPGLRLIQNSDCRSCHKINEKSIGPSFYEVAERYDKDYIAKEVLAKTIIGGGVGNWGEGQMPAHPDFTVKAAKEIVDFIFSVNDAAAQEAEVIKTEGQVVTKVQSKANYRFEASYKDRGGEKGTSPLSAMTEVTLRLPVLQAESADSVSGFSIEGDIADGDARFLKMKDSTAFFGYREVDLSNIDRLELVLSSPVEQMTPKAVKIELHGESPDGLLLSSVDWKSGAMRKESLTMELKAEGKQDIYLVFKSESPLVGVDQIKFHLNR
ncbi:PQQ-dependent sugar dehydrogenase [Reichenbachiella ulvae]|uniref:PQQ-dependent sugar dehydrogenase n=1 Tax=Reichenbachiella ulvae TaxID=2980104 RepID=A0ABT3CYX6_9BACT|nr:PQQ-dependent sugar dehydrogenase [Reichenbachiella ulvae]MCV9388822.1 PQQ-dependent sugar dehydrogenase [Reichenbachiella ulvae]